MAVDPLSGDVLVGLAGELRRFTAAGGPGAVTAVAGLHRVAADGLGGAWVATPTGLHRIDPAGQVVAAVPGLTANVRTESIGGLATDRPVAAPRIRRLP